MIAQIIVTNFVTVTNTVSDLTGATTTFVKAIMPHLTAQQDLDVVGSVILIARLLRKLIPDKLQTGKAGQWLKHFAVEINPVMGELKPIVTEVEPLIAGAIQAELQKTTPVANQQEIKAP